MAGIGVIGLGVMGARMLGQIGRHHGLDAVIAWDPSDAALERALDTSPGLIRAGSVDEVTAFPDIACVYIASPPSSHLDYIELACEQGKAVFCEKPLALDDVAARAVVERIERDGHPAAMNFPHASAPAAVALARELDNGRIGAIEQVSVEIVFPQWPESWQIAAAWLCKRAQGGFVREVVTHKLFLARRLLGPLELVHADITWPDDAQGAETAADIRVKAGGVPVHVRGRVEAGATEVVHWTVTGERGALRL
ncbi:MAG: Gfo/Idh/MocA family oxidoreductase, partial [Rhodospirillaceae bacterium]|nr:Gfo/Idh/MocA family oxidoreductase [Rhodospirillaceae bacterium]